CMDKSLQELHCKDGYITVSDTRYINHRPGFGYPENELVIINDTATFHDLYQSHLSENLVDFSFQSIVAINIPVGAGSNVSSQGCLCYNPDTDWWMFNIEYTISNQCKGSGIYSMNFTATLICPKLPNDAQVEFDVRDINPF
ncbi:MAG TPA: hypothetical protein PKD91_10050, partial [Bacteroidia bacterium]|nr:hypothetical protein [Bacteroidia bacterium]